MANETTSEHSGSPSTAPPAPPRRRRLWIAIAAGIVLALFLLHHFTKEPAKTAGGRGQQGNATITVGQSRSGDIGIYVNALGTVTPTYTVTVYSQITGRVMAVHYQEGQMVRKGDPLIDIDPRPYEATLVQAEGTLQRDEGLLAQAKMDLQRYQDAYARNAIAKQQLDDQAQIVVQYAGTVKADRGTVDYDKVQLEYCHIVSPIAGRVGLRLVDPGNTVFSGTGSTLVVITQLQPITVVFNVSEDDLPRVQSQLTGNNKLSV
ncbi:MAG TPA: efflux RND transporter periplasmic adaptor subunit, partial [Steroidobacteraceae bacterium]|nr:efflux RND transporter periplasmic adaptor subunit [Steroidobacteraceae bacterium]